MNVSITQAVAILLEQRGISVTRYHLARVCKAGRLAGAYRPAGIGAWLIPMESLLGYQVQRRVCGNK